MSTEAKQSVPTFEEVLALFVKLPLEERISIIERFEQEDAVSPNTKDTVRKPADSEPDNKES